MKVARDEYLQIRQYQQASRELNGWISGARVLALLIGALEAGVLERLRVESTPQQIAAGTGLDEQDILDLCLALEAHHIVKEEGGRYQLTPDYAQLDSASAPVPLARVIRQAKVMTQALQRVDRPDSSYTTLPPEDVLAMAEGAGISALSSSKHVSPAVIGQVMPEVEARWLAGAHHLEVGCGVGNSLFGIVMSYPEVTAVGIEINGLTAAEAERRAGLLGINERVVVRPMDAGNLQDKQTYDTIQWSQFFFPAASRPMVLAAMGRALKPGGYLLMPWLGSVSADTRPSRGAMLKMALRAMRSGGSSFLPFLSDILGDSAGRRRKERRFASLQRLLFRRWGVPVRSLDELAAEVASSGLTVVRTVPTPASQLALTRGFLLAKKENENS